MLFFFFLGLALFFYFSKFKTIGSGSLFVPFKYGEEELDQLVSDAEGGENPSVRFRYTGDDNTEFPEVQNVNYLSLYKNDWVLYEHNDGIGVENYNYGYHFSPKFVSIRDILNNFDFSTLTDDNYLNRSLIVDLYDLKTGGLYTVVIRTENDLYFYLINKSKVLNKYIVKDVYGNELVENSYNPEDGSLRLKARPSIHNISYDKKCAEWDFEITGLNTDQPKHKFTCINYKKSVNYVLLNSTDLKPLVVEDLEVDEVSISTYYKTFGDYRFLYSIDDSSRGFDVKIPVYDQSSNKFVDYKDYTPDQFVNLVKEYYKDYIPEFIGSIAKYYDFDKDEMFYYKLYFERGNLVYKSIRDSEQTKFTWAATPGIKKVLADYEALYMFGVTESYGSDQLFDMPNTGGGPRPDISPDFIVYKTPDNTIIYTTGYLGVGSAYNEKGDKLTFVFRTLLRKYTLNTDGEIISDTGYMGLTNAGLGYWPGFGYGFEKPLDSTGDTILWFTEGIYEIQGPQNFAKVKLNAGTAEVIDTYKFALGMNAYDANESTWGYTPIGYFYALIGDKIYYSSTYRSVVMKNDIVMKGHDNISVLNLSDSTKDSLVRFPEKYKYIGGGADWGPYLYFSAYYSLPENYYSTGPDICLVYNTESNQLAEYTVSPPSSTNSDPYCSNPGYD